MATPPVDQYREFGAYRPAPPLLESIAHTLDEILAVQRHLLAMIGASSDSRSSCEIKTSTRGVDVAVKSYSGSDVAEQVGPAVDAYFAAIDKVQQRVNSAAEGRP